MKRILLSAFTSLSLLCASGQLQVYPSGNINSAMPSMLGGANVSIDTVSYLFDLNQIGLFRDSTASIGLDSGVVMSTGYYFGVLGPNTVPNSTVGGSMLGNLDPDISYMSLPPVTIIGDPAILNIDLVPWGDTLSVRYVFGSEEYDEYVCSNWDDRVGMFLSGPGITGPFLNNAMNIATLPISGLPVTVNTTNRGTYGTNGFLATCDLNPGWLQDTIYYLNNDFFWGTQLDGYTVVLTAHAIVTPGAPYHLKIAIADLNDMNYDSAVFLAQGGISCSDISTGIDRPSPRSLPDLWCDPADHLVYMRGFNANGGAVQVEAFDAAGRLLQRSIASRDGVFWNAHVNDSMSGMLIVRATQTDRVITGRVFMR